MSIRTSRFIDEFIAADRTVQILAILAVVVGGALVVLAIGLLLGAFFEVPSAYVSSTLVFLVILALVYAYLRRYRPRPHTPS